MIKEILSPEQMELIVSNINRFKLPLFTICTALLVYCVCRLFSTKKVCISKSKDGTLLLTKRALKELIESLARESGIQGKICVKVSGCKCKLSIDLKIRAESRQNLQEVFNSLHSKLQEVLVNNMGITAISKINIIIVGFLINKCDSRFVCKKSNTKSEAAETCCCDFFNEESE